MAQEPKRNSTRPKKVPSYLRMDDNQYGLYSGGRNIDTKENKSNPQELTQTAKLLMKFLNASNQRAKVFDKTVQLEQSIHDKNSSGTIRYKTGFQGQKMSKTSLGNTQGLNTSNKIQREKGNLSNGPYKAASKNHYKKEQSIKNGIMEPSNTIQSDLSYHSMLRQHIRTTLPDQRNLSAETLMKLGLPPKEMLDQKKVKDVERKKSEVTAVSKTAKGKEQLKPFRRQSYHVAIAYHIYLKQIKSNPNPSQRDLDPTSHARKLRQQKMKP